MLKCCLRLHAHEQNNPPRLRADDLARRVQIDSLLSYMLYLTNSDLVNLTKILAGFSSDS